MRFSREGLKNAIGIAVACAGLACALVSGLPASAHAEDQPIIGVIDQARLVKIPDGTDTLIIGNPTIAGVTLLKQKSLMVLTPKAFGETNFIALDTRGNPIAESVIRIVGGDHMVVVQRGTVRESYSCATRCQPTAQLGDDSKYLNSVSTDTQLYTGRQEGTVTSSLSTAR